MALPSTNITFGAVNQELNGSSVSTISLDNARVRSLGLNRAASGTSFSASSLASKSAKWAVGVSTTTSLYYEPCLGFPYIDQSCLYTLNNQEINPNQLAIRKFYLNGTVAQYTAITGSPYSTYVFLMLYSVGVGPYNTSNLYAYTLPGASPQPSNTYSYSLTKINSSGVFVSSLSFIEPVTPFRALRPTDYGRLILVDTSENVFFAAVGKVGTFQGVANEAYILTSVNSSFTIRWALQFPLSQGNQYSDRNRFTISGFDSSYNVYVQYFGDNTLLPRGRVGYIKLNSTNGTELLNRSVQFGASSVFSNAYQRCGVGKSGSGDGVVALFGWNNSTYEPHVVYYNSAGTFQWARKMAVPANTSFTSTGWGDCVVDKDGSVYIILSGRNTSTTPNKKYNYVIKFNSSGTVQWQKRIWNSDAEHTELATFHNPLNLTGNDSLLTIGFWAQNTDEYNYDQVMGVFTINSDGSTGNGSYNIVTDKLTLVCDTTSLLTVTSASVISSSTSSFSSVSLTTSAPPTQTGASPFASTVTTINVT
jgi:hypothetical protein